MDIDIVRIFLIVVFASLAWWANLQLNKVPTLNNIVGVLIVVIAVVLLLQSLGIMGHSTTVRV